LFQVRPGPTNCSRSRVSCGPHCGFRNCTNLRTTMDSFKGPDGKTVDGKGKYVCVWRNQGDGSWKAVHDMWNSDSK